MECGDDSYAIHIEKFSAQLGNRRLRLKNRLRSKRPETAHNFRSDRGELFLHKRIARRDLIRFRIAILRRPALKDIADVDVFALEVDRLNNLRQQLPRSPDERQALLVFVKPGSLADEYQIGFRIAGTENDVGARRSELAALAIAD